MSFVGKLKDGCSYLKGEYKKHSDSWLLIIFASIIITVVVSIILVSLSKKSIFPKDSERYDIDAIYVGQMKDFCPKEFAANPGKKEFEACVLKLDINKMVEVKIPTFNDTLGGAPAPNLPYMMKYSSDIKLKKASEYFKEGNYFVIGIKIPEKYFTTDGGYIRNGKINEEKAFNNYVLTFKEIRFGTVCVGNSCDTRLSDNIENVNQVQLIKSNADSNNSVWIFGLENKSPHGIWLTDGIFVARSLDLYTTHNFYSFVLFGKPMFAGIALVALFLVSIPFAIYLRRFFDYPAFSYFAASTALWFVTKNFFVIFPWLQVLTFRLFNIWVILNFLLSILILNLTYVRFKLVLKKKYFVVSHILILLLVFCVYLLFGNIGTLIASWGVLELIFADIAAICALIPLALGIYDLLNILKRLNDPRISTRLDYKRRIKELCIYSVVWMVFCSSYIYFAFKGVSTGTAGEFFSITIGLALLLLGIMLYYTHSKEITHMASDSFAELERLYRRKTTREFCRIVKNPFEGILLVLDMANSSGKDGKQKRKLMESILDICNKEANKNGFFANFVKSAGDDWKIIFMKKNEYLADDLLEMTLFAVNNYKKLELCVKDIFQDSSLHMSVFALSNYVVYVNENQESEYGYKSIIDFSSSEVDLMLKYIEKSRTPNTIMVAGNNKLFTNTLNNLMLENKTTLLRNIVEEKHKESAEKLNIIYGLVSYKTKPQLQY